MSEREVVIDQLRDHHAIMIRQHSHAQHTKHGLTASNDGKTTACKAIDAAGAAIVCDSVNVCVRVRGRYVCVCVDLEWGVS